MKPKAKKLTAKEKKDYAKVLKALDNRTSLSYVETKGKKNESSRFLGSKEGLRKGIEGS